MLRSKTPSALGMPDKDAKLHDDYNEAAFCLLGISPLRHPYFAPFVYLYDSYLRSHKTILDLGIGLGLQEYHLRQEGYSVFGYENSEKAIIGLETQGIPFRKINLNSTLVKKPELAYRDLLEEDLSEPTNIVTIHSIQYMQPSAIDLLIFDLMTLAQPETTFFFVTRIFPREALVKDHFHFPPVYTQNYIVSFFGARTDMNIEFLGVIPFHPGTREVGIEPTEGGDQIFIVRKRLVGMFDRSALPVASATAPAAPEFKP